MPRRSLPILPAVFLFLVSCSGRSALPHGDILDLREGWEYKWEDPSMIRNGTPRFSDEAFQNGWKPLSFPAYPPQREGRKVGWLRVTLPDVAFDDPSLYLFAVDLAFEAYFESTRIYGFGNVDPGPGGGFAGYKWHLIGLPGGYGNRRVYFRIFSDYTNLGITGNVFLGPRSAHILRIVRDDFGRIAVATVLCALGILSLCFFLIRRVEAGFLHFGVFSLCLGLYFFVRTRFKQLLADLPFGWFYIEIVTLYLSPIGILLFFRGMFSGLPRKAAGALFVLHAAVTIAAVSYAVAYPAGMANTVAPIQALVLVESLFLVAGNTVRSVRGDAEARIITAGFLAFALTCVYDTLVTMGALPFSHQVSHWGMLVFLLSLLYILIRRYLTVYADLEAKTREKETLLKDLHDGIGGLASNIKFLADLALMQRDGGYVTKSLADISRLSEESLVEMRLFLDTYDESESDCRTFSTRFRYFAGLMLEQHGIEYGIDIALEENLQPLANAVSQNVMRIFKEMLSNIVKHSKARHASIRLRIFPGRLSLAVEDDGVGIGADPGAGRGMGNMRHRAETLGAELRIGPRDGGGTALALAVPLPIKYPSKDRADTADG